jgi:endothelin-converting enzyme/putative endopeptidase
MKFNKRILFAVPAIMGLTAMQAQTTKEVKEPGINVTIPKTKPQDDFFRFVNGTWLTKHKFLLTVLHGSFNELLKRQIRMP